MEGTVLPGEAAQPAVLVLPRRALARALSARIAGSAK